VAVITIVRRNNRDKPLGRYVVSTKSRIKLIIVLFITLRDSEVLLYVQFLVWSEQNI
jgi:hypothetical protein